VESCCHGTRPQVDPWLMSHSSSLVLIAHQTVVICQTFSKRPCFFALKLSYDLHQLHVMQAVAYKITTMGNNTASCAQKDHDKSLELEARVFQLSPPSANFLSGDTGVENVPDRIQTLDGEGQDTHSCGLGLSTPFARATIAPKKRRRPTEDDGQSASWASDQGMLVDSDEERHPSRPRKRPSSLDLTKTRLVSVSQPLSWRPLPSSRQELFITDNAVYRNSDETYELEQHRRRNQHVLGLKYIFERYSYPRRPALQPDTISGYIDKVSGYHDLNHTARGPPPGLATSRGQYLVTEHFPQSYLCRFWHHRMQRHLQVERIHEGNLGRDSMRL
jgi:hypothetical protein